MIKAKIKEQLAKEAAEKLNEIKGRATKVPMEILVDGFHGIRTPNLYA